MSLAEEGTLSADPSPTPQTRSDRFAAPEEHADVAVIVVTYQSAGDLDALIASLRVEAQAQSIRVVVADNASTDGSLEVARAHDDVVAIASGGNLGYAGGINAATRFVGDADAILVLNPDLVVEPGCVAALRERMRVSGAGVVVPRILESDGSHFISLRREPSVLGALGDAAFGEGFTSRPSRLSEYTLRPQEYTTAHPVEWATGAALLIDMRTANELDGWDERFFLYSEETDYFHRVRAGGDAAWFEPAAVVRHAGRGSGVTIALEQLIAVNRIRYARKHLKRSAAAAYRAVVALHYLARSNNPVYRAMLGAVASEKTWTALPRAQRVPVLERVRRAEGTIVVNGCGDPAAMVRTIHRLDVFRRHSQVGVLVAGVAGFGTADAALDASAAWPRVYVDAGVHVTAAAVLDTLDALRDPDARAAHPLSEWDLAQSSWLVRSYFRARDRAHPISDPLRDGCVCGFRSEGDASAGPEDARVVLTDTVRPTAPDRVAALLRLLRGTERPRAWVPSAAAAALAPRRPLIHGPFSFLDAGVYWAFGVLARVRPGTR